MRAAPPDSKREAGRGDITGTLKKYSLIASIELFCSSACFRASSETAFLLSDVLFRLAFLGVVGSVVVATVGVDADDDVDIDTGVVVVGVDSIRASSISCSNSVSSIGEVCATAFCDNADVFRFLIPGLEGSRGGFEEEEEDVN